MTEQTAAPMPMPASATDTPRSPRTSKMVELIRPHWKALTIALVAVVGETLTDILEPWPIKIVVDNILQSKPLPAALAGLVSRLFGQNSVNRLATCPCTRERLSSVKLVPPKQPPFRSVSG